MKWLTPEQVEAYATTPTKAREISTKHWWQNSTATKRELLAYIKKYGREAPIIWDLCGLCHYYKAKERSFNCCSLDGCPVTPPCDSKRSLYQKACEKLTHFLWNPTDENFQEWQKAGRAVHKDLCSLRH